MNFSLKSSHPIIFQAKAAGQAVNIVMTPQISPAGTLKTYKPQKTP